MPPSSSSLIELRRSKSTSSVSNRSHHSSTLIDDPTVAAAHQNALVAANLAFVRANGRENVPLRNSERASLVRCMDVIHEGPVVESSAALKRSQSRKSAAGGKFGSTCA
jgi:hypothetical protein